MIGFVLADLRRHWAASLVIALIVALATALGVAITLEERALRLGTARAADAFDLVIGAPGSETQLVLSAVFLQPAPLPLMPGDVLARLAKDPRVVFAAPVAFGDSYLGAPLIGTTTNLFTAAGQADVVQGRLFERLDEAVLGAASPLGIGDSIVPMHGQAEEGGHAHGHVRYRVVGRRAATGTVWDKAIFVPVEAVWQIHGLGKHHDEAEGEAHDPDDPDLARPIPTDTLTKADSPGLPAILVKPKSIADAYRLRGEYRKGPGTMATFPGEVLTRLYGTLGDIRMILAAVAAGAQGLVAAAIALVAIVHVAQRRRQIGALRAFGAPRHAIFGIVWLELFALAGAGIAAGYGIGFGAARLLATSLTAQSGIVLPVTIEGADLWAGFALMAGAALVSGLPAALAWREPAAAALRNG